MLRLIPPDQLRVKINFTRHQGQFNQRFLEAASRKRSGRGRVKPAVIVSPALLFRFPPAAAPFCFPRSGFPRILAA